MNKKTIKLLILTSIFSSLLTSQVYGQNNANLKDLLANVEQSYKTFSKELKLKPDENLLKKLKDESNKSPTEIQNIDTKITENLDSLIDDLTELDRSVNESETQTKQTIKNLLNELKPSEKKDSLGSILELFRDKQLLKEEICNDIQTPLKVNFSTEACGTFYNNTYTKIQQLFETKDEDIKTKIGELKDSLKTSEQPDPAPPQGVTSLFKEPLFIWTFINTILTLGLIGGFILFYSFIRQIEEQNNELYKKNERRKKQIKDLETREENRNQQINKINDRIFDFKKSLESLSSNIANLLQNPPQIYLEKSQPMTTSSKLYNSSEEISPSVPENVRLTNLFKENPQSLIHNAIRVEMTKETLNKVISGIWEGVVELEASRQGEYYIVASNSGESYLFLDPNTTFNVPTLQNINKSQLFICHGNISQSFKGNEINITRPAIVKPDNQNWQLMESGEIQFI